MQGTHRDQALDLLQGSKNLKKNARKGGKSEKEQDPAQDQVGPKSKRTTFVWSQIRGGEACKKEARKNLVPVDWQKQVN